MKSDFVLSSRETERFFQWFWPSTRSLDPGDASFSVCNPYIQSWRTGWSASIDQMLQVLEECCMGQTNTWVCCRGQRVIVQIDESMLAHKLKYNRQRWAYGMVDNYLIIHRIQYMGIVNTWDAVTHLTVPLNVMSGKPVQYTQTSGIHASCHHSTARICPQDHQPLQ